MPPRSSKKSAAKRSTAKRSTAKRSTARRSTAKRTTAKRSTAKRSTAKRSTAKRSAAKRSTAGNGYRPSMSRRFAANSDTPPWVGSSTRHQLLTLSPDGACVCDTFEEIVRLFVDRRPG